MNPLTPQDILWKLRHGARIYIVEDGQDGRWETFLAVDAWMDMEDVVLVSGRRLLMEDYGDKWEAYTIDETDKKVLEILDQHSFLARRSTNPAQSAYYSGLWNMADLIYAEKGMEIVYNEETCKHRFIEK